MIATGTPFDGNRIDLTAVVRATEQVGTALREKPGYHTLVVKSTVVPGTTEKVVLPALEKASGKKAGADLGVGMNPEFLSQGEAVNDFMEPDRIVLGGIDDRTLDAMARLYAEFPNTPTMRTTCGTAELIKYASNSLLAVAISFANEFADLSEAIGNIDNKDVMEGMHLARVLSTPVGSERVRAGITSFLKAGCGYGGSCLPKDTKALLAHAKSIGVDMPLLEGTIRTNAARPARMVAHARKALGSLSGKRIAVLGLAFKPLTDDTRETPSFPIIELLRAEGATVRVFDPVVPAAKYLAGKVEIASDVKSAVEGAAAVMLVTTWPEFKNIAQVLNASSPRPLLVDGRRFVDRQSYRPYAGIGWTENSPQNRR
jgi:UDPglucose 6-dehydrogenase/GDP-mannose 6-dehydrogenase